jgi:tRNA A-37 threonylcarbamoyl transferase component Bud32
MSINIDDVLTRLELGILEESAARTMLESLARESADRAQVAIRRIETDMAAGRLAHAVARSLLDALQGTNTDKTLWIDSKSMVNTQPIKARAPSAPVAEPARQSADIVHITQPPPKKSAPVKPPTRSSTFIAGTVVKGRYRLLDLVGQGRTPLTFNAVDLQAPDNASASVVVKLIIANFDKHPEAYQHLESAVESTRRLVHPHIATPLAVDREGDVAILIYAPLKGRWLSTVLRELRNEGMRPPVALPIFRALAESLAYAHAAGIAHGEFNPRNILLTDDGTPTILNFAIAPALAQAVENYDDPDALDTVTMRAYTEAYSVDPKAASAQGSSDDVYALGLIAYELLSGKHPFRRQSLRSAREQVMPLPPLEPLTPRQNAALARSLSFEVRRHPGDARAFLRRWDGPTTLQTALVTSAVLLVIAAIVWLAL